MNRGKLIKNIKENVEKINELYNSLWLITKKAFIKNKVNDQFPWMYIELFCKKYLKYFLDTYRIEYKKIFDANKYDNFKETLEKFYKEILKFKLINMEDKNLNYNFGNPKEIEEFINKVKKNEKIYGEIGRVPSKELLVDGLEKLKICIINFINYLDNMIEKISIYLNENNFKN